MSGSTTPGQKPAKTMSSRLLTMKFMQRAAASAAQSTVEEAETPSPKRPRLSAPSSPSQSKSDLQAVNAALAAEEQRRAEAVARQAAEAGETEWVLDFHGTGGLPAIAYPAQPAIIAADSLDAETQNSGRKCFGNFKPEKRAQYMDVGSESDNDGTFDPSDPAQLQAMVQKQERRAAREAEKKARMLAEGEHQLRKLTSISGGRGSLLSSRSPPGGGGGKKKHGGKSGKKRSR